MQIASQPGQDAHKHHRPHSVSPLLSWIPAHRLTQTSSTSSAVALGPPILLLPLRWRTGGLAPRSVYLCQYRDSVRSLARCCKGRPALATGSVYRTQQFCGLAPGDAPSRHSHADQVRPHSCACCPYIYRPVKLPEGSCDPKTTNVSVVLLILPSCP